MELVMVNRMVLPLSDAVPVTPEGRMTAGAVRVRQSLTQTE